MDDDGKITDSRQPSHEHNLHESPSHHHHHHISHVRDNQHASTAKHHSSHTASMDVMPPNGELRRRSAVDKYEQSGTHSLTESIPEGDFEVITPENAIEAHRMVNNYKFGFKKWKSHVTARPLSERSNVVQDLYADIAAAKPVRVSTLRPTNVLYIVFVGWWMFLIYLLMALLMTISVIGYPYASYCIKMGTFFLWPFGKFVYLSHKSVPITTVESHQFEVSTENMHEGTSLITPTIKHRQPICSRNFWGRLRTYPWLILCAPILLVIHVIVMAISWFFVVTIPIAKVNLKMVSYVMWLPPDQVSIGDSGFTSMEPERLQSEIIMYTHQSINIYYYKYTIDGMNIILVNLLVFVLLSIAIGYFDVDADGATKCMLAVLAIVPLTYYIGMAIISISAQSSFAIGAVLNATFGSLVELILYIVSLQKGKRSDGTFDPCYAELVKSGLAGTLIGCVLLIPGICMIVGGIRYRSQRFNPKSASVTALLLFVSIGGVFAPTLFSKIFGDLQCDKCEVNVTNRANLTEGLQCTGCSQSIAGLDGDDTLFNKHIQPLVYAVALILPITYITGVVFTLKTHTSYVYDDFYQQLIEEDNSPDHHGAPQWSRLKSIAILMACATLIALCAELIADNIQELLEASGVSQYFIGVTMIAMIPELPEIVNGIQFALQNNVNLGLEIGTNTAIQVCLIQVPLLVLVNLIYPFNFVLVFNDVHLWAVIFSVIVINYIFQDGKTDYFQGVVLCAIYIILLCMYYFTPTPEAAKC
ncbi:uncharacterized protein LOC128227571 [Mya arenaria]|uniref:uncharacterized protein LOC128227571 n=1 Tax=Mya arenaria TaxID=6604 RepID=UPI0022E0BEAF|nr:uncharacterized protein LOC128227571 [Mya arenaria]XP_052794185.1 uncharacterized protein LOC128227571 [Mya arenaria]